jgi:WD40 repeat protein
VQRNPKQKAFRNIIYSEHQQMDNNFARYFKEFKGPRGSPTSMIQLSDGRLAVGTNDTQIYIWNIKNGKCLAKLQHDFGVIDLIELSPNLIASIDFGNLLYIWELKTYNNIGQVNWQHDLTVYAYLMMELS